MAWVGCRHRASYTGYPALFSYARRDLDLASEVSGRERWEWVSSDPDLISVAENGATRKNLI